MLYLEFKKLLDSKYGITHEMYTNEIEPIYMNCDERITKQMFVDQWNRIFNKELNTIIDYLTNSVLDVLYYDKLKILAYKKTLKIINELLN